MQQNKNSFFIYSKTLEVFPIKTDLAVLHYKVHNVPDIVLESTLKVLGLAGCLSISLNQVL